MSKHERLRMQWRDSKRRCCSSYLSNYLYDKLEFLPDEQRNRQIERSRISNAAVRQNRTENEWADVRKKHQIYKKAKLAEESNNQRFWRLIKRRQYRRKTYHNDAIMDQYEKSIGKYGYVLPEFPDCKSPTDQSIQEHLSVFYDMLRDARCGKTKPIKEYQSKFESFKNRGIDVPQTFFDKFLDYERAVEN